MKNKEKKKAYTDYGKYSPKKVFVSINNSTTGRYNG